MEDNFNNSELIIDFNKILKIILSRKKLIALCFTVIILLTIIITGFLPKKYTTESKLLINKSSSTNLGDINPFVVSEMSTQGGGMAALMGTAGNSLGNEVEVIKSSLVLDNVIRENDLKFTEGPRKGEYMPAEALLTDNLTIEIVKASNVISIAYKSTDPKLSYGIVNSIINNYKEVHQSLNSKKSSSDKMFLKKAYLEAKASRDAKIQQLKQLKNQSSSRENIGNYPIFSLAGTVNNNLAKEIRSANKLSVDIKKLENDTMLEEEKFATLKNKYDWSSLSETMSKNATNITILKKPEMLRPFENTEPNLKTNIFLASLLAIAFSSLTVFVVEKKSRNITFSDMDLNTRIIKDILKNIEKEKSLMLLNNVKSIALISFLDKLSSQQYQNFFKNEFSATNTNLLLSEESSPLENKIADIKAADSVIIIAKLNHSSRESFQNIKTLCKESGKKFVFTFLEDEEV